MYSIKIYCDSFFNELPLHANQDFYEAYTINFLTVDINRKRTQAYIDFALNLSAK